MRSSESIGASAGVRLQEQGKLRKVVIASSVHRWNDTRIYARQAASLAAHGYDVALIAVSESSTPFEASGLRVLPLPRLRRHVRWINWFSILWRVLSERASIVHVHDPELFPLAILLRLIGKKTICDVHEDIAQQVLSKEWIPKVLRGAISRSLEILQQSLPRLVDAVILAEDSYRKNFPAAPNVHVIHNFPLLSERCERRNAAGVLRLIYVGDVRIVRGIREYVTIADRLAKSGVPVELWVVGSFADPKEEREIRRLIEVLGLQQRVRLLGRRPPEEINGLVRQCDIGLALLHPIGNYRESYPTKMFEYMDAGVPVVASRFSLWEAVLAGNECGRVVDPLDVEEAVAAIMQYWRSPELRRRHGENGRAAAIRQYNWGIDLPDFLSVYSALRACRAAPAS
jgi:glycosyltransferase involved in cell wall biosynthesis